MPGILDFLNGDGSSTNGLLDFLRANALNQPLQVTGAPGDMANYGPSPQPQSAPSAPPPFSMGGPVMSSPIAANPQSSAPAAQNANAAMPARAPMSFVPPPPQNQPPIAAAPAAPASPGFGDRLGMAARGFMSNMDAGPIGALMAGTGSLLMGRESDPTAIEAQKKQKIQGAQIAALRAHNVPDVDITAALANPEYMKKILDNSVKEQDQFRPATAAERQAAGMTGDNNTPMFINSSTNEPKFGPPQTNVNVSTEKTGQAELATLGVKAYTDAQSAARESQKRLGMYDAFEKAAQGFTPGATAEMRLTAKRYLKDAGLIKGDDVPDGEIQQMIGRQLAIHAQPKGQGAVSNYERQLYSSALPSMIQSPEGLKQAIGINRKLEQFDQQIAQIYRDSARANKGLPNYLDVQDKIAALGSPLADSDMAAIQPTGAAPSAAPAGVTAPAAVAPRPPGTYVWTPGKGLSK